MRRPNILICGQSLYLTAIQAGLQQRFPAASIVQCRGREPWDPESDGTLQPDVVIVETNGGAVQLPEALHDISQVSIIVAIDPATNSISVLGSGVPPVRHLNELPEILSDILDNS